MGLTGRLSSKRFARRALLAFLVLTLVGGVAALRTRKAWDTACSIARQQLPLLLSRPVTIGECELDPLGQRVILRGVSLDAVSGEPFSFAAEELEVRLGWVHPFSTTVPLDLLRVQRPQVKVDGSKPSRAKSSAPAACPLKVLKYLQVARLDLQGAELEVNLPQGERVQVRGLDMAWRLKRGRAELEIEARGGLWERKNQSALALRRLTVSGALVPKDALLELHRAELNLDDLALSVTGRINELCTPKLELDAQLLLPLRTVARVAGWSEPASGHVWARAGVHGGAKAALQATVDLSAHALQYGRYQPGSFQARLSVRPEWVFVESFLAQVGQGSLSLKGNVGLTGSLPLQVQVETQNASFGQILARAGLKGAWVDFAASTQGKLSGKLLPRVQLTGEAEVKTGSLTLATRAYDAPVTEGKRLLAFEQGRVQTQVELLHDRAVLKNLHVESGRSRIQGEVTLFYDPARGLSVKGQGDLELSDFKELAELPWAGRGTSTFSVVGPYKDVRVEADLSMRDFEFWGFNLGVVQSHLTYADRVLRLPAITAQKGKSPYFGNASLLFGAALKAQAHLDLPEGRTEDVVEMLAGLHPSLAVFRGELTGKVSAQVDLPEAPVARFTGTAALRFADTVWMDRRMGAGQALLRFDEGQALVLDRAVLEGPLGKTWAEGRFTFDGAGLDYRLGGEHLVLKEVLGEALVNETQLAGRLNFRAEVSGNGNEPVVTGDLESPHLSLAERDIGPLKLSLRQVGEELQVWGQIFRDARGSLRLKVKPPFAYDSSLTLSLSELGPFLPRGAVAQRLSGSLTGVLTAQGQLADVNTTQAKATVDRLTLSRGDFHATNEGPIQLSFDRGRLDVQSFHFRGPNTELSAAGFLGPKVMDLTLRGALDVRLLESFVGGLERAGGKVELNAVVGGTLERPSLVGSADILDAKFSLHEPALAMRALNGRLEFSEQRVLLEDLNGFFNEGRIRARGDVRLERFTPKKLEVSVQLDEVALKPTEDLPLTTTGELMLTGPLQALLLTGDLDILRLRYQKGLELEAMLRDLARRSVLPMGPGERGAEFLTFDVKLHLGDVRVINNLARARLLGDVRLTGTNLRPGLLGTVQTADGSRAFFRNNEFVVNQGVIEFADRYRIDPIVDLHAQTQTREFLVKLHAFGRLKEPQVVLSAEPDLSEGDILSLLTLGVTSRDTAQSSTASAGASLAAEAFFNFSGLDRQVKRFLPSNPVLRDMSFQISSTYNDASGQVEATAQLESKFLTEQLKLGLTQPVSGRGRRAQAEYRFDNRLSAQAQWDNENSNASFGNLGLELKLSWEVE